MSVVKVSLGDDIRRFSVSLVPSFVELVAMLEKVFGTPIRGSYDVKYLDPENDQITVTSDAELVDAFGMAPRVNEQKVLRLYLVPKGTNPALMASVAPAKGPVVAEVDLTSLLSNLASSNAGAGNNGANAVVNLLTNLLSASNANQGAQQPAASCGNGNGWNWMSGRPEDRVHMYYVCDGCESSPVRGNLHQCDVCPDYHLCEKCRDAGVHLDKNHSFTVNPPRRHACTRGRRHMGFQHERKPDSPVAPGSAVPTSPAPVNAFPVPTSITKPPVPVVSPVLNKPKPAGIVEATGEPIPNPFIPQVHVVTERLEMSFLSDVTIPDGTEVFCGENFSKVWRLSNSGSNTWPLGCRLSLESSSGERLSSVETIEIPGEVPPGSAVTISVEMEAPKKAGRHASHWRMHGPTGTAFGNRIWVDIIAVEKPAPAVVSPPVVSPPASTAASNPSGPASEPSIKADEPYATQLESLYRMGFLNIDLNRNLLEHARGNLPSVIDQLVSHQH